MIPRLIKKTKKMIMIKRKRKIQILERKNEPTHPQTESPLY